MGKIQIRGNGKCVITNDFVNGLLHCNFVNQTLEERIFYHPKDLLKKMIKNDTWRNHPKICEQCIDRLYAMKEYGEVTRMFKFFIHQKDN